MYMLLTLLYHFEFKKQFDRVVVDRKLENLSDKKITSLCESYCRIEFRSMLAFQTFVVTTFVCIFNSDSKLSVPWPNISADEHLPMVPSV